MSATTEAGKVHLGRNIKRIREILKIKQQTLASQLGEDWNQKKISQLEDKEVIDDALLADVAKALNVPVDAIKEFDEQSHVLNIQNNYENSNNQGANLIYQSTINPIEKWLEVIDKNEKLYERLLQSEKEKVELLQKLLDKK
ncbi:MAG: helix-turn-helix transcriptional regulator [Agriterribacter sp.]